MMHSCQQFADRVTVYIDDEMPWAEWVMFRMHMLMCPACAYYLESMEFTVDSLRESGPQAPSAEVRATLLEKFSAWKEEQQ